MAVTDPLQDQLLDAAERLYYANGIQSVGMDRLRADSGVSLKRIYQLFPTKEHLVIAYLRRRHERWLGRLAGHVAAAEQGPDRVLAIFDWLRLWFAEPDFHGCAWINAHGELGASSADVAAAVRDHKRAFRRYVTRIVTGAGYPATLSPAIYLLAEGAMVTAGIGRSARAATDARNAARLILAARPAD